MFYRMRYSFESAMGRRVVHAEVFKTAQKLREEVRSLRSHIATHPDYKLEGIDVNEKGPWNAEAGWEEVYPCEVD